MQKVIVVGALGMVGEQLLHVIESRRFPFEELVLLAKGEQGEKVRRIAGKDIHIQSEEAYDFSDANLVFAAVNSQKSAALLPTIPETTYYIDFSTYLRMDPTVPLIIPEINGKEWTNQTRIATPNCATAIMLMPLGPLHKRYGLHSLVVSSYQSVSGAGKIANQTFFKDSSSFLGGGIGAFELPYDSIAFNCFPQIGDIDPTTGYANEEQKIIEETRKILNLLETSITVTAVRVPVFIGHSLSVVAEFNQPISVNEGKELIEKSSGVTQVTDIKQLTPRYAQGKDDVFVGRWRQLSPNTLSFFVTGDNLRRGAALNAVLIAEMIEKHTANG